MKKSFRRALAAVVLVFALLAVTACAELLLPDDDRLEPLVDAILADDADAAYKLFNPDYITAAAFEGAWGELRAPAAGATGAEIKTVGWHTNTTNGVTTTQYTYQVDYDNGSTVMLSLYARKNVTGYAALGFHDATDFLAETKSTVTIGSIVLLILSLLSIAFCIWMIVDCARRRIKGKALWIILILLAFSLLVTTGEKSGLSFSLGIFIQLSSVQANIGTLSLATKVVIPLGAIVYFFLRKRLTMAAADAPAADDPASTEALSIDAPAANTPDNDPPAASS